MCICVFAESFDNFNYINTDLSIPENDFPIDSFTYFVYWTTFCAFNYEYYILHPKMLKELTLTKMFTFVS